MGLIDSAVRRQLLPVLERMDKLLTKMDDTMEQQRHIITDEREMLNKINLMISRSDARVDTVHHMVDNCLELSRLSSSTTESSAAVVKENSEALTIALRSQEVTNNTYNQNIDKMQKRMDVLQEQLTKEQANYEHLSKSIDRMKDSFDSFVYGLSRPNINIPITKG